MRSIAATLLFSCAFSTALIAQKTAGSALPSLFAGYSLLRSNTGPGQCGCFYLNGGNGELFVPLGQHVGAVASVSGQTTPSAGGNGVGLSLVTFAAGPRFTLTRGLKETHRVLPFVEALVGYTRSFGSFFPSTPPSSSANAFTFVAGGGVDIRIGHNLYLRPAQVDYALTTFQNGTNNRQNNVRLGAGMTLQLK